MAEEPLPPPMVPVSWGELIDKITILEIKQRKFTRPEQSANVRRELDALKPCMDHLGSRRDQVEPLKARLAEVNGRLWDIEDRIRDLEHWSRFDDEFVALARSVYVSNDRRAAIKREINTLLGSTLIEEKQYAPY